MTFYFTSWLFNCLNLPRSILTCKRLFTMFSLILQNIYINFYSVFKLLINKIQILLQIKSHKLWTMGRCAIGKDKLRQSCIVALLQVLMTSRIRNWETKDPRMQSMTCTLPASILCRPRNFCCIHPNHPTSI